MAPSAAAANTFVHHAVKTDRIGPVVGVKSIELPVVLRERFGHNLASGFTPKNAEEQECKH
jgi:hypothetical protein